MSNNFSNPQLDPVQAAWQQQLIVETMDGIKSPEATDFGAVET